MTTEIQTTRGGQLVTTTHVADLLRNYKKERWAANTAKLGKEDSLSTWYNLEALQAFLELARKNHADGIKMYYGVYPENFQEEPEFSGRQTVVLVATKQKCTASGTANKDIYITQNGKSEVLAFNFGTLCPPYCGTIPGSGSLGITILEKKDGLVII